MSRILNGSFSTQKDEETLSLCHCWEITLTNGNVIRLTDHDKDLTFLGETFVADNGFRLSMLESGENMAVDNAELDVLLSTNNVDQGDIISGVYDGARVKIYRVNWQDPSSYITMPGGYLSELKDSDRGVGVFQLVNLSSRANQSTGRTLIPTCDADVGDARCGVNLASFTTSGTVISSSNRKNFTASGFSEADGYFNYGVITWTSGANSGLRSEVKIYASLGTFELVNPTQEVISGGDTFTATAGCDRLKETCKNKFDNLVNFRGFPFVVGTLKALGGPKQ